MMEQDGIDMIDKRLWEKTILSDRTPERIKEMMVVYGRKSGWIEGDKLI